jgi:ubiquinone/menaquinone biosynthesis C-methylase UbiE
MTDAITNQQRTPAEVYDEFFVPALFQHWAAVVAVAAKIRPGEQVLDVACGTGALTTAAKEIVGSEGSVTGLDINPEMLTVARRKSADIDWREGPAEHLPFDDDSFDAVVSQFGCMFFEDRPAALREMMRVLRPGGHLAVAVCDGLDHSPGYSVLAELLHRLFGAEVAEAFRDPFVLGDKRLLQSLCTEAQIDGASVTRHDGSVKFASIESLISTERACVWTLGGLLDSGQFELLRKEAQESFQPFVAAGGAVAFLMPALMITATKR